MDNRTIKIFSVITIIFLSLMINIDVVDSQLISPTFTYKINDSSVTVGDSTKQDFKPILTFESLDSWFNIYFNNDELISKESLTFIDEKVTYIINDYELWYYQKDRNNFEFEIIITQPMKSNILTLGLDSYNLDFRKQLPLNQEYNKEDWDFINETYSIKGKIELIRPLNIVNSYAVYYINTPKGLPNKAYHIYTNTVTDSKGNMIYTDLNIDAKRNVYEIIIDQKYLDNAVYPLRVSPTFGKTSVGETGLGNGWDNSFIMCKYTSSVKMNISNILVWGYWGNGGNCKGVLFSENSGIPDDLLIEGSEVAQPSYSWSNSSTVYELDSNITFWMGYYQATFCWGRGDSGETSQTIWGYQGTYPTVPTQWNPTEHTHSNLELSSYVIYEEIPEIIYNYDLDINSTPTNITFTGNTTEYETLESFTNITQLNVTMPYRWFNGSRYFDFLKWDDDNSTDYQRLFTLTDNLSVTAIYTLRPLYYYELDIQSTPDEIDFYINGSVETTSYLSTNITKAILQFPNGFIRGLIEYGFLKWDDDNSTNPFREMILTENKTVIAEYEVLQTIILPQGLIPEQTLILGLSLGITGFFGLITGLVLINVAQIFITYMWFNDVWTLNQQTNTFCWGIMLLSVVLLLLCFAKSD